MQPKTKNFLLEHVPTFIIQSSRMPVQMKFWSFATFQPKVQLIHYFENLWNRNLHRTGFQVACPIKVYICPSLDFFIPLLYIFLHNPLILESQNLNANQDLLMNCYFNFFSENKYTSAGILIFGTDVMSTFLAMQKETNNGSCII